MRYGQLPLWRAAAAVALASLLLGAVIASQIAGGHAPASIGVRAKAMTHAHSGAQSKDLASLPLAAQAVASAALGGNNPAYRVGIGKRGLVAVSVAQDLQLRFASSGVSMSSGPTRVRLNLESVGFGRALTPLGAVAPHAASNRVLYRHAGVSEWYVNGPLGLEQGFTVEYAPAHRAAGPLTLAIGVSGNTRPALVSRSTLALSHAGGPSLRYSHLLATDAQGRTLPSWLELRSGRVLLRVDARGARFPLRIDPLVQQGQKLTGSSPAGDLFGAYNVALSSDGNTALVGGYADNNLVGAVWVFTRTGSTWTQQGEKLTGGGETGAGTFGISLALSQDGNTALIGGSGDNGSVGAAWVFTRAGSTWTQEGGKLTGTGESGSGFFGEAVALSADASLAIIGGPGDNGSAGAVWAFTRSGSTWTQQGGKLTAADESGRARFGVRVALSSAGDTALIGGSYDNGVVGAAWVFTLSGSTWTQQGAKLTGVDVSGKAHFGSGTALSSDGNTALIGAYKDNGGVGAAFVFTRSGATWTQQGPKLTGGGEAGGGEVGYSVALSSDGNTALVGGRYDNNGVGAAWVFTRAGSTWTQQGEKLTGSGESGSANFGVSAALSTDGSTALLGAPQDSGTVGAAWVFTRAVSTWTQQGEKLTGSGEIHHLFPRAFGASVSLSADGNTALVGAPAAELGAAFVLTRSGSTWTQQGPNLVGAEALVTSPGVGFGSSVSLSSDGNTALIGGGSDDEGAGAAWIFKRSGSTWSQQGPKLTGSGEIGSGFFGHSVALSGDGGTAVVGGYVDNGGVGAAWVFTRSGETWSQQGPKLTGGEEVNSSNGVEFGTSTAVSFDGSTALVGGPADNKAVGAAWVFTRSGESWSQQGPKLTGGGQVTNKFMLGLGFSVALSADGNTALVGNAGDNGGNGAAWVFSRTGVTWAQQGEKLKPNTSVLEFGESVALTADGNTALIGTGLNGYESHAGGWVFTRTGSAWTQQGARLTGSGQTAPGFGASVALSSDGRTALIGGQRDNGEIGAAWVFVNPPASPPEFGRCVAVGAGTGKFENSGCTKLGGAGKFEWYPGVLQTHFTTKAKELAIITLGPVKSANITCKGELGSGEITGYKTVGNVVMTLTGCERLGEQCSSASAAPGEVVTTNLEGVLGVEKASLEGAIKNLIGLDLFPPGKTGPFAELSCGAASVALRGSIIVPIKANTMALAWTLKYASTHGKQKPEQFEGEPKDVLEASFSGSAFEQIAFGLTTTQTLLEKVEVNSVN